MNKDENAIAIQASPGAGVATRIKSDALAGGGRLTPDQALALLRAAEAERLKRVKKRPGRADGRGSSPPASGGATDGAGAAAPLANKSRNIPIVAAIVKSRSESLCSLEETVLEICRAGISVKDAEQIIGLLWGAQLDVTAVGALGQDIAQRLDAWRNREIEGMHPYVFLTRVELRRTWGGSVEHVAILIAKGVTREGFREVLGVVEGTADEPQSWYAFIRQLRRRGLQGVELFIGEGVAGQNKIVGEFFPTARFQRCAQEFQRELLRQVPASSMFVVQRMLKAIYDSANYESARKRAGEAAAGLEKLRLPAVARLVRQGVGETLNFLHFPPPHRRKLHNGFPIKKLLREVREHTRIVGAFSNGCGAVHVVCARLRFHAEKMWDRQRYVAMVARPAR